MAKPFKILSWVVTFSGWLSSVLPGVWGAMIATVGTMLLLVLTAGEKVFANAEFLGATFLGTLILWTYIGVVWLATRKIRDVTALRYGITFEGILPSFNPSNAETALSFALAIRNYSPSPIRYFVEEFDVQIETRTLPTKYQKDLLQGILSSTHYR